MNIFRKKTKIVCTIGPASHDRSVLRRMVKAGMNCARLNFSHGTHDDHAKVFLTVRAVGKELGVSIAIIQDLQGPKIRLGVIEEGERLLKKGQEIVFSTEEKAEQGHILVTYPQFHNDVNPGEKVFLCDGAITLEVLRKKGKQVTCKVINPGIISSHKGLNLPETTISAPSVTEKDLDDLDFGLKLGVDYVAISFVRKPDDVLVVKDKIRKAGKNIPVIAKIEKPEAVKNINGILAVADAIMVARGDLGVEVPIAEVPGIQKEIIKKCDLIGKPVITATQMLESMINNPFPTRAEVTDVANAVLDGTSAVMLSGETAVGKYPVKVVGMMAKILVEAEKTINYQGIDRRKIAALDFSEADAIAHAAVTVADDMKAKALVPFTISGSTAMLISKYRPKTPVIPLTPDIDAYYRMALYWNVYPYLTNEETSTDAMIETANKKVKELNLARQNDILVLVAGVPIKTPGITNLLKVHQVT